MFFGFSVVFFFPVQTRKQWDTSTISTFSGLTKATKNKTKKKKKQKQKKKTTNKKAKKTDNV